MSLNEEVTLLRRIPLFAKIDAAQLKLLAFTSERVAFPEGEILFRQGDTGDAAYVIIEGDVDVMIETDSGPVTVASMGRNEMVGEIAIICDVPRTATVQAKTRLETLVVSKELFFRLVTEFPQMGVEVMRELAERLEKTNIRLREALADRDG